MNNTYTDQYCWSIYKVKRGIILSIKKGDVVIKCGSNTNLGFIGQIGVNEQGHIVVYTLKAGWIHANYIEIKEC